MLHVESLTSMVDGNILICAVASCFWFWKKDVLVLIEPFNKFILLLLKSNWVSKLLWLAAALSPMDSLCPFSSCFWKAATNFKESFVEKRFIFPSFKIWFSYSKWGRWAVRYISLFLSLTLPCNVMGS